jgi:hypothetical protein
VHRGGGGFRMTEALQVVDGVALNALKSILDILSPVVFAASSASYSMSLVSPATRYASCPGFRCEPSQSCSRSRSLDSTGAANS